jgi:hypothetical protein
MKSRIIFIVLFLSLAVFSCKKASTDSIGGSQSAMGLVGATVSSSMGTIAGVSSITGRVTTLADGVSSFSGSAVITNATIKNIMSSYAAATVSGNNVSITDVKVKFTSEGIESFGPLEPGIIAKFDSKVGDTYPCGSGKRTVTAVSTTDDFYWGGMMIKVMKVEETPNKLGIKKIIYYSNHKWGLAAVEFTFEDNSVALFPVISSASN